MVLDVVDRHGSGVRSTLRLRSGNEKILYFEIQLKMKKKAAALTAITAQTDAPIRPPVVVAVFPPSCDSFIVS